MRTTDYVFKRTIRNTQKDHYINKEYRYNNTQNSYIKTFRYNYGPKTDDMCC